MAINLSGVTVQDLDGDALELDTYRGSPALLVLGNQRTSDRMPALVERLGEQHKLPIVQIAHLRGVPRMLHRVVERDIRKSVVALRAKVGVELAMGLDYKGDVTSRFGFTSRSSEPLVVHLNEDLDVIE